MWYFLLGVLVGWITKFPLLLKWYRELKRTKDYKEAQKQELIKRLEKQLAK